jgi:hypothetical protein
MSFTKNNYPAAFASEGNPAHGRFPGDFNPHIHGVEDTMDVNDDKGFFSIEVCYSEYTLELLLMSQSTWRGSQSWQLLLL